MLEAAPSLDLASPAPVESASGTATLAANPAAATVTADDTRLRAVIDAHFDALWRFLRRMGVAESTVEDAAQQVLVVFARKLPAIAIGAERSFLFGTALRVAADARKHAGRTRAIFDANADASDLAAADSERFVGAAATGKDVGADVQIDDQRARRMLDEILSEMAEELRAVFVMCDIEEMTMADAASVLELPPGTVASRLRRAREIFAGRAAEMRTRFDGTVTQ